MNVILIFRVVKCRYPYGLDDSTHDVGALKW